MNYHRKQWERTKRNPYAKELREDKYRQRKIDSKQQKKPTKKQLENWDGEDT